MIATSDARDREIQESLRAIMHRTRQDPVWYVNNVLGEKLWRTDRCDTNAILRSAFKNRVTLVASCHAAGKSHLAARAAQTFFDAYPDSKVITTAPTYRQVRTVLWSQIPVVYEKARKALEWTEPANQVEIRRAGGWVMFGFATAKNADNFQGQHALQAQLIIGDEASGLAPAIVTGIKACLTGVNTHLLLIGNPTDPHSQFARYWERDDIPSEAKFHIPVWDTPNFRAFGITREDIPSGAWRTKVAGAPMPYPQLVDPQWVSEVWQDVRSFDDPFWVSRVEARFPSDTPDQLIPMSWIEAAMNRSSDKIDILAKADKQLLRHVLGVDVAEQGGDEAVCYERLGPRLRLRAATSKIELRDLWDLVDIEARNMADVYLPYNAFHIDATGIGSGVHNTLIQRGMPSHRFVMAEQAREPRLFGNMRADLYWNLRQWFDPAGSDVQGTDGPIMLDEKDQKLARQLSSIKAKLKDGKRWILSKSEMKAEGFKSPDRADAAMLAMAPSECGDGPNSLAWAI